MEFHANKALFKSDTVDPFTGLPIYVFDSNYLPDLSNSDYDKKTVESLMLKAFKKIITRIPNSPYVLICFTSGFRSFNNSNNSWVTLLKCYQLFPETLKENMRKVYMVHESWLIRSFTQILTNVVQLTMFKRSQDRIHYCRDLTELSKFVDITKLRISLDIYLYDSEFVERLIIPYTIKKGSQDYLEYRGLIEERVMTRLLVEGYNYELVFTKPGNQKKLAILNDAIERGNYLDLSQWDIYVMGTLCLGTLRNREYAMIPIDLIELPIRDDFEYTLETYKKMELTSGEIDSLARLFEILLAMLKHSDASKHDLKSLSKSITPALCKEKISIKNNDRLLIGQRFIKNLLEGWDDIMAQSINLRQTKKEAPRAPPSRKMSFQQKTARIPRPTPELPRQNVSDSSVLMIAQFTDSLLEEDADDVKEEVEKTEAVIKKVEVNPLSDVTSTLNRLPKPVVKKNKPVMKFADGYSSIEGQKKVNKLAQLYEERLRGLRVLDEIEKNG
jgi:hypothetical protein